MKISFKQGTPENARYRSLLSRIVADVGAKISTRIDPDIKWIIFDPDVDSTQGCIIVGLPRKGHDYGHCCIKEKKIFISTLAIKTFDDSQIPTICISGLEQPRPNCFLADVIMDELAHINTKKNHGDPIYEEELGKYRYEYYCTS